VKPNQLTAYQKNKMLTICTDNHEAPGDESIQVKVTTLTAKTKMID